MLDDATLVERCLQGDTGAFDALVARYRDRVFSLADWGALTEGGPTANRWRVQSVRLVK